MYKNTVLTTSDYKQFVLFLWQIVAFLLQDSPNCINFAYKRTPIYYLC